MTRPALQINHHDILGASPPGAPGRFAQAGRQRLAQCHLLRHAVNSGKGRALKTGFEFFCSRFQDRPGLVTADGDGQHRPADILRVAEEFDKRPTELVLGARRFSGKVPLRSRLGNRIMSSLFGPLAGQRISDTQTGLRAIPAAFVKALSAVEGERFEFELAMLIAAGQRGIRLREVPIETVYLDGNRASHFDPLRDSLKVFLLLVRSFLAGRARDAR